jgi:hypothetical protein
MREEFLPIKDFEDSYAVSNYGRVININTDHEVHASFNQQGVLRVNLVRASRVYNRSVNLLVIHAFDPHWSERFNSVINIDGDRGNNHISNLAARPRWFTVRYNRMFVPGYTASYKGPVRDVATGEVYPNSLVVAKTFGLIDAQVREAMLSRTFVFPTNQMFEEVEV